MRIKDNKLESAKQCLKKIGESLYTINKEVTENEKRIKRKVLTNLFKIQDDICKKIT